MSEMTWKLSRMTGDPLNSSARHTPGFYVRVRIEVDTEARRIRAYLPPADGGVPLAEASLLTHDGDPVEIGPMLCVPCLRDTGEREVWWLSPAENPDLPADDVADQETALIEELATARCAVVWSSDCCPAPRRGTTHAHSAVSNH